MSLIGEREHPLEPCVPRRVRSGDPTRVVIEERLVCGERSFIAAGFAVAGKASTFGVLGAVTYTDRYTVWSSPICKDGIRW